MPENFNPRKKPFKKPQSRNKEGGEEQRQNFAFGIHAVESLITNESSRVHKVIFKLDSQNKKLFELQKLAKKNKIATQQLPEKKLDNFTSHHQGVIALCHERALDDWTLVKNHLLEKESALLVFICGIEDPRNLGAALRSSLALNVDAVLLPGKGNCGLTPLVGKTSCGALEKIALCRPSNLEGELDFLCENGFELVGLDAKAEKFLHQTSLPAKTIIAVGGENRGIPPFVAKRCNHLCRIPMNGEAHSYNTSVALSLALYEAARQRSFTL